MGHAVNTNKKCMYVCMYVLHMYVHIYVCMYGNTQFSLQLITWGALQDILCTCRPFCNGAKIVPVLSQAPLHEGVWGGACVAARILNLGYIWRWMLSFALRPLCRKQTLVDSSWNVMAHADARVGKWRGNWRMEWVASTLHTTSEHSVSSITTADAHT